jgi:hypothetical protein
VSSVTASSREVLLPKVPTTFKCPIKLWTLSLLTVQALVIQSPPKHHFSEHRCTGDQAFNTWDFGGHLWSKP